MAENNQKEETRLVSRANFVDDPDATLEQALDQLLSLILVDYSPLHIAALSRRLGWSGHPPITLQEAGNRANVTRERIRQIEARIKRELRVHVPHPVKRLVAALPQRNPELWSIVSHRLVYEKITQDPWSISAIKFLLEQAGYDEWLFRESRPDSIVGRYRDPYLIHMPAIVNLAMRICRSCGAASLSHISEELQTSLSDPPDRPIPLFVLRKMLSCIEDIKFLDNDYIWVPVTSTKRVRVQNVARKMLSVNRPLNLEDIKVGLTRKFSFRNKTGSSTYEGIVPPVEILRKLFNSYKEFSVSSEDLVDFVGDLSPETELTKPELGIYEAFQHYRHRALNRQRIKEFVGSRSINMSSFEVEMTYSPIVTKLRQNVWSLVGTNLTQKDIDRVQHRNQRRKFQRRLIDYGFRPNGDLALVFKLPSFVHNFVASVPSEMGGVKQEMVIKTQSGVTLRCKNGAMFGFGKFLSRTEWKEGDFLVLDVNLENHTFNWFTTTQLPAPISR